MSKKHLPTVSEDARQTVERAITCWREHLSIPWANRILVRITCKDGSERPLNADELSGLAATQQKSIADFETAVQQSHPLLLELTEKGAEPVYVLSLLMRFETARGTEPPRVTTLTFRPQDFDLKLPGGFPSQLHALDAYARAKPVPARLQASRTIFREPARPRKRGPEGVRVSAYMALLAYHFQETTGWHQYRAIAALVSLWCPWLRGGGVALTAENVRRRVNRAELTDGFRSLEKEWAEKYRRGLLKAFQGPQAL